MNQFSFSSEQDRNQSHCLQQEIGFEQIGDWRGNSQQKVEFDGECVETMLSEFNMDLDQNSQIVHSFTKHGECSQVMESLGPDEQKCSEVKCSEEERESQETSPTLEAEQQAITFYDDNNNTTILRHSVLQIKWQQGGKNALNEFWSVCQSNYNPLLRSYKETLEKLKAYNERSIGSLDMYCLFFRIKRDQETKRLMVLKTLDKECQALSRNQLLENVYLEERTVVAQLSNRSSQRRAQSETFCEQIDESINKIKILLSKAVQIRNKKFENLESLLDRIDRIQQELIELLNESPTASDGWLGNSDIKSDRYLQRKYLHEREALYLALIVELGEKLVDLLNVIFVKEDPIIFAVLNRELIRYKTVSESLYGAYKNCPVLKKITAEQLDNSLSDILKGVVPAEWNQADGQPMTCESIIERVNDYLQNQIYLPVVELDEEYVQLKLEGTWIPRSRPNENTPNMQNKPQSKQATAKNQQWQSTYQALVSDRNTKGEALPIMKVNVVLTIDKYLHLQCGQQIASLKLKRLKLSRKDKRIVISEKNRSIASLFTSATVLGELEFQTDEASQNFINAVMNNHRA